MNLTSIQKMIVAAINKDTYTPTRPLAKELGLSDMCVRVNAHQLGELGIIEKGEKKYKSAPLTIRLLRKPVKPKAPKQKPNFDKLLFSTRWVI